MKNKKIKIIGIIIIIVIVLVVGWNVYDREKTRKWILEDTEHWVKVSKWFKDDDAVIDVKKTFRYMLGFLDESNVDYEFYRKYLSQNEINSILRQGYQSLEENFGISNMETEKILELFIKEKSDDNFENYMEYLGKKAYYEKENGNCKEYITASIYDDHVLVKEKNFIDENRISIDVTYTLVLRDKDLRLLYFVETERDTLIYKYDEDEEIKINVKNADSYDYYFNSCRTR